MKNRPLPNPADLRMILGQNLRKLCADQASISDLCRRIGVNRTQFNRYLSGTAFPRPDVLYRICAHFGVDANILLYHLGDRPFAPMPSQNPLAVAQSERRRPFDHYLLPDGMYQYWRKSFRQPNRAYLGMALIKTIGDTKIWKGYDVHAHPTRAGSTRFSRSTSYEGTLTQQFDGFTLISRTPYNDLMNITYFEYGLEQMLQYYSGLSFVTRRRMPEANRLTAVVMQRLPNDCAAWLSCARACGNQPLSQMPEIVQSALNRVPDQI